MNITEDVVRDLLPAYFSGEASRDTHALVDAYFGAHPGFEAAARRDAAALQAFEAAVAPRPEPGGEKAALGRAKAVLAWQRVLLAIASTLTLNAVSVGFSFEVGGGRVRVHWLSLPGQAQVVAAVLLLAVVAWVFYFRLSRRVRTEILG
jgi:predicted anti-sigma-YlaC factor YlaD